MEGLKKAKQGRHRMSLWTPPPLTCRASICQAKQGRNLVPIRDMKLVKLGPSLWWGNFTAKSLGGLAFSCYRGA